MSETLTSTPSVSETPRWKKIFSAFSWGILCLVLLTFFTLTKISETYIKDWSLGFINQNLRGQSLEISADEMEISWWTGPSILLKRAVFHNTNTNQYFQLDEMKIAPSILSLFTGKAGAKIYLPIGEGSLDGRIATNGRSFSLNLTGSKMEVQKAMALAGLPAIQSKGLVNLDLDLSGDIRTPTTWTGEGSITGKSLSIEAQNIMGIDLPQVKMSELNAKAKIDKSKVLINEARLGKTGDDLALNLSGDVTLSNRIEESTVNMKANLSLSTKITSSLSILDALLSGAKQPNGSYAYTINGPIYTPIISPVQGP